MRTNCEQFADRGDPMDARVPLWAGLEYEPRRARMTKSGDVVLSEEFFSWNELPAPEPYVKPKYRPEKPDPVQVQGIADSRLAFNQRMKARTRRLALIEERRAGQ